MGLQDVKLKMEYRSPGDNMVTEFYIPLLRHATLYRRSVGFFSSTSLIDISKGIASLVKNGGHIQMIASPKLSDEDIEAIDKGYEKRDALVEKRLLAGLDEEYTDYFALERLNLLANLIADGRMDIHIALIEKGGNTGMYHEKLGIISDDDNNAVAFSGSMNESNTAIKVNYETTDVFRSWSDPDRVELKIDAFNKLWSDSDPNVRIIDFPSVPKKILEKYRRGAPNLNIDEEQYPQSYSLPSETVSLPVAERRSYGARCPEGLKLHTYQQEAIDKWAAEHYHGIYDMATGTGKTLTGLASIARLSKDLNDHLAVIIVCPYQHLVEQWVEDIVKFNIKPIIGYGASPQPKWKERLKKAVRDLTLREDKQFFCLICTNATFRKAYVQTAIDEVNKIGTPVLLVVDEAHNAGAVSFLKYLDDRFKYRLALSATMDRHMDETGTKGLYDFFGRACINYPLKQAIKDGHLTQYRYHVIPVSLTDEERMQYEVLTKEIGQNYIKSEKGYSLTERGKLLAIQRSRIVAAASEKMTALRQTIEPYRNDKNILIYCGAANVLAEDEDKSETAPSDVRQIDAVTRFLGLELKMRVAKFTSDEDIKQRESIKDRFQKGDLQAIVAIKCLDEGVNIPAIKTAFILASTTNPKEYIQRRGRVLRKFPGKEYAEIYDFVTLPRPLNDVNSLSKEELKADYTLVINEIRRMKEFSESSQNSIDSNAIIWQVQKSYDLTDKQIIDGIHIAS